MGFGIFMGTWSMGWDIFLRGKQHVINYPWLGMVSSYHLYIYDDDWGMVYGIVLPRFTHIIGFAIMWFLGWDEWMNVTFMAKWTLSIIPSQKMISEMVYYRHLMGFWHICIHLLEFNQMNMAYSATPYRFRFFGPSGGPTGGFNQLQKGSLVTHFYG